MNFNFTSLILLAFVAMLVGCVSKDVGEIDHHILCDPATGYAYSIGANGGDSAMVHRMPTADSLCK